MNGYLETLERRIDAIPVPAIDLEAIRKRAEPKRVPARRRRRAIAAVALTVAMPLLVAAAAHFIPLEVTHRFGNWQLNGPPDRGETIMHPAPTDFARVARAAPYAVLWPSGLPRTDRPLMIGSVGSEVFVILYTCAGRDISRAWSSAIVIPRNYSLVNKQLGKWFSAQLQDHPNSMLWDVGDERVLFGSHCLTMPQIADVRASMRLRARQ